LSLGQHFGHYFFPCFYFSYRSLLVSSVLKTMIFGTSKDIIEGKKAILYIGIYWIADKRWPEGWKKWPKEPKIYGTFTCFYRPGKIHWTDPYSWQTMFYFYSGRSFFYKLWMFAMTVKLIKCFAIFTFENVSVNIW